MTFKHPVAEGDSNLKEGDCFYFEDGNLKMCRDLSKDSSFGHPDKCPCEVCQRYRLMISHAANDIEKAEDQKILEKIENDTRQETEWRQELQRKMMLKQLREQRHRK